MDVVAFYSDMPYDLDMYEQSVRKAGERILKRAQAAAEKAGVHAETRLLEVQEIADRVADEIERAAKRWKADLLVIGTHGRRGVRRLLLGSVAESLVRISSMPVLLIRGQ
jgi:nucleotide-binding universal stress UspA family protein